MKVGYKSPPPEHRFKKGQVANPKGRPKGSLNLKTIADAEFAEMVPITEGGRKKRIQKGRAIVKKLYAMGLTGNLGALIKIIELQHRHHGNATEPSSTELSPADQKIADNFLKRLQGDNREES